MSEDKSGYRPVHTFPPVVREAVAHQFEAMADAIRWGEEIDGVGLRCVSDDQHHLIWPAHVFHAPDAMPALPPLAAPPARSGGWKPLLPVFALCAAGVVALAVQGAAAALGWFVAMFVVLDRVRKPGQ